jgi:hypothetical protein
MKKIVMVSHFVIFILYSWPFNVIFCVDDWLPCLVVIFLPFVNSFVHHILDFLQTLVNWARKPND